ncbi:hypothetical protein HMN09_01303500 [Mycena chlorophos]|uniref:Uncharacterized protein n=1 Tax=Mycena chlorophos TaxID=658473 RepID=A0A8H6S109_MYCCL|nr:hypothetical protein HMN09_01303500 [Mycena chlorophos]
MSSVSLSKTLGAILIGTYVNSCLYVLALFPFAQVISRRRPHADSAWLLVAIAAFFTLDTLATVAGDALVFLSMIAFASNGNYLPLQSLLLPILFILSAVSALMTRLFLGLRYWKITEKALPTIVLGLTLLATVAGTVLLAITLFQTRSFFADIDNAAALQQGAQKLKIPTIFFLATSVACDIATAAASLALARRENRAFGSFTRICTTVVKSNVFGALFSIGALIAFVLDMETSTLWLVLGLSIGRIHTHATLRLLNSRRLDPRRHLPHKVEITSFPFMPDSTGSLPGSATFKSSSHSRVPTGLFTLNTSLADDTESVYSTESMSYMSTTGHHDFKRDPESVLQVPSASRTPSPGARGGHDSISPPVLIEDPTPANLNAGIELLREKKEMEKGLRAAVARR